MINIVIDLELIVFNWSLCIQDIYGSIIKPKFERWLILVTMLAFMVERILIEESLRNERTWLLEFTR